MVKLRETLSRNLIALRKKEGLTQSELAERANMAPRSIQNIEYAENWSSDIVLEKLAEALNVDPRLFFARSSTSEHLKILALLDGLSAMEMSTVRSVLESLLSFKLPDQKTRSNRHKKAGS